MNVRTNPATHDAEGASQSMRAQLRLREMIVGGELAPGARIAELAMVEALAMSRTPIRTALVRLQEEGLLEALPSGGFSVRDFSEADIHDAIELRGTLEGLAARLAAERGAPAAVLCEARGCLAALDAVLAAPRLSDASFARYAEHNARFHALLAAMSGSALVQRQVERAAALPFASPNGFVMVDAGSTRARDHLRAAHEQHHALLEAIAAREGARAEALAREHARNARRNLADALCNQRSLQRVPGARLIRPRAPAEGRAGFADRP
ncbi:MAG TPA: GntR family transcriptional regulator [Burkholderiaceae bacterium]|nr:GntR family transcriptional regulator [Burkholderiaceae bacterium]